MINLLFHVPHNLSIKRYLYPYSMAFSHAVVSSLSDEELPQIGNF